jgi:hypothetical protein
MEIPEVLLPHEKDYKENAWMEYDEDELWWWVYLYTKRATQRNNPAKKLNDLTDARNYLEMWIARYTKGANS